MVEHEFINYVGFKTRYPHDL